MKQKHQKHAFMVKPKMGRYAKNEWAIVGTPCGVIQHLAHVLSTGLKEQYRVGYMDADHANADEQIETPAYHSAYTDKIQYHQFSSTVNWNDFDFKAFFQNEDLLIVNGNHFPASQQIVVIDAIKEQSLKKRIDQLTNIQLILIKDKTPVFDWLKDKLHSDIPQMDIENEHAIVDFVRNEMEKSTPELHGVVLAGGKSVRMNKDKGLIDYHGVPQREYVYNLLEKASCMETFYSLRKEQTHAYEKVIEDSFDGLGPFGAILSAFRKDPNKAYFVVACDYPNLDLQALQYLVKHRDPSKMATCFHNPATDFPEPTIVIWEPKAYPRLLHFLSLGYSCPRKVLINSDVSVLNYHELTILNNVNTPEEYEAQIKKMN